MPSLDIYHDLVKTALQAEGWTITHDPYPLSAGGTELYIDLGAQKIIAAIKVCSQKPFLLTPFKLDGLV